MNKNTLTARNNLDAILPVARNLPIDYWRSGFWFRGAPDETLHSLTGGLFPHAVQEKKTHPVYALKALPGKAGFRVCPCSSKRPYRASVFRFIREGCVLKHKNYIMDRNAYLIESVIFNIPASLASHLYFAGEVPEECIECKPQR